MRRLNPWRSTQTLCLLSLSLLLAEGGCKKLNSSSPNATINNRAASNTEAPSVAAKAARERGDSSFESRDDPKKLADAISLYEKAAALDPSAESWLRIARAYELSGRLQKDTNEGRRNAVKNYTTGFEAATAALEAISPGGSDKSKPPEERFSSLPKGAAEIIYHYALLQWRWAQSQGTAVELSLRKEIMAAAQKAASLDPNILGAAPYRLLGELYAELPVFASGSLEASKDYFQMAITLAPDALENRGAFARTYAKKADPGSARTFYDEIYNADPTRMKDLIPENRIEQQRAKTQLDKP
jgi:tetratricopeptide (TPR) repeat protein